jgi:predicted dehydrogenase
MSVHLTPEQREIGKANFQSAVGRHGLSRRDFMKGMLAAGTALPITAAVYYGYKKLHGSPVKVGLIGAGDEGGVLVGEHNREYLEIVAVADIRPSNMAPSGGKGHDRIFVGEGKSSRRKGLNLIYGGEAKRIKRYVNYHDLLADKDIEAVIIALPLHLHAPVSIDAMRAGKHVLCEKLMAWNVSQCKDMIRVAEETDRILSIGHQRHYSLLYAHAVEVLRSGELGDIKHIRALWHRNNSWPSLDKDGQPVLDSKGQPVLRDGWKLPIAEEDRSALDSRIHDLGYKSMEELVRWRLFNRTGGGLMAELGSHQLDACSIFLGKVHPLAVSGVGGKFFYHDDRECDDHVFVTFEFPGPNYYADKEYGAVKDKNDIVVVTYSSINTNSFEPYGECVMGTHGTMLVERESEIMLFPQPNPNKPADAAKGVGVTVTTVAAGKPALDSSATTGNVEPAKALAAGQAALGSGPPSPGYREEMEDFAYCVRMWNETSKNERRLPRCHGRVAMADAIVALTSNQAMRSRKRIEFRPEWFQADSKEVPDPEMHPVTV